MSALTTIFSLVWAAAILVFLFLGTFFLLFLERFVSARVQHREGPGRGGRSDVLQVWKDYRKVIGKEQEPAGQGLALRVRAAAIAWRLLPVLFILILLGELWPRSWAEAEVPSLLLLPLMATALEATFLHAAIPRESYQWRKQVVLRMIGASLLAFGFLAISMHTGSLSLSEISNSQRGFPFLSLISSPGLFLSGLASFGAIYLYAAEAPIQDGSELGLNRSMHYLIFIVRKAWIFCLLCFWVLVFFGGVASVISKALFPLKVGAAIFLFTLLQGSFPRIRTTDAGELATRWLFRLCFLGLAIEAIWVGVWG